MLLVYSLDRELRGVGASRSVLVRTSSLPVLSDLPFHEPVRASGGTVVEDQALVKPPSVGHTVTLHEKGGVGGSRAKCCVTHTLL
jgi:hypothetical protein